MEINVANNIGEIVGGLPAGVRLVAISKYHSVERIEEAYRAGQRVFGESREQELRVKKDVLPNDIKWHFIGHLQTNKVKYIAPYISMIETVDSFKLMSEINKQAEKHGRVIDVLLELHIADEISKYGFKIDECREMLKDGAWRELKHVRICGLMMMASNVDDAAQIAEEMNMAADFFDELKRDYFSDAGHFCERSWGMSQDYKIALGCRSTMVRIGSGIFGEREY